MFAGLAQPLPPQSPFSGDVVLVVAGFVVGLALATAFHHIWLERRRASGSQWIRALLGTMPGGAVIAVDRHMRIVASGGDALDNVVLTHEVMRGRDVHSAGLAVTAQMLTPLWQRAFTGETPSAEIRHNDHIFLARATPVCSSDGSVIAALAVTQDITDDKEIEMELRRSEALFRSIFEHSGDGIMLINEDGVLVAWNTAMERLTGLKADQVLGMTAWDAQDLLVPAHLRTPERTAFARQMILAVLGGHGDGLIQSPRERSYPNTEGIYRTVQERYFSIPTERGRMIGVISRDVTELHREHEQRVINALQQQRADVLNTFIRDTSHEFRTPLSVINTKLYFIERTDDRDKQNWHIEGIREQVNNIVRLLDTLVTMSRLDLRQPGDLTRVNLRQILYNVVMAATASAEQLRLAVDAAPALPHIFGSEEDLTELFRQLVDNAVRYTPDGGSVDVFATHDEVDGVKVTVRDTGIGIPADAMPHIFDRFFRLDDAHSTRGFGLGLPIARRIVELHGGTIDVESVEGQGTEVRVTFPALSD